MKTFTFVIAAAIAMTACGSDEQMMVTSTAAAAEATVDDIRVDGVFVFEDGFITVPFDRDNENAGTIELAYTRMGTTLDGEPILLHFGGPGSSATERIVEFVKGLPAELLERYTFIGLDEIGVGESPAINCFSGPPLMLSPEFDHPFLVGPEEDFEALAGDFAGGCATDPLIDQGGTARYVRDIDQLREALGYDRMNIWGFSYGTEVALLYGALFPDRVGRLALDSTADPRTNFVELISRQSLAFAASFDRFLAWCETQSQCSITADEFNALVDDLASRTDDDTIELAGQLLGLVRFTLANELRWPGTFGSLQEAIEDPMSLLDLNLSGGGASNVSAFYATMCNDSVIDDLAQIRDARVDLENMNQSQLSTKVFSGRFLPAYICGLWGGNPAPLPVDSRLPPPELASSILAISASGDTQTPRSYTEEISEALPELSVVRVDEVSHAVSGRGLNPCLRGAVVEFFTEGTVSVSDCPKSGFASPAEMNTAMDEEVLVELDSILPGIDEHFPWDVVPRR